VGVQLFTVADDDDIDAHSNIVLDHAITLPSMNALDPEQATTVPLPLSPPVGGSTTIFSPLPDLEHSRAEPATEEKRQPIEEEELHENEGDADNAKSDFETTVVEESAKEVEDSASLQTIVAYDESAPIASTIRSERPQEPTISVPTIPPTPPGKPDVHSEVRTSLPRHDSLTATSPRTPTRPSVERLDSRASNGHVLPHEPPSRPTSSASHHRRSLTISKGKTVSAVLVSSALETIAASREAKRSQPLRESVQRALEMVKHGEGGDRPREIFEPLRLACETRNEKLMIASLDCISKLISYSFFVETTDHPHQGLPSPPPSPGPGARSSTSSSSHPPGGTLVDLVVHTITSCHTESTPETVSLQIVKALLALVLSPTVLVHQSSLLKAVRTVYNVFLLSIDPINQTVAQGGLTQMVNHVFARCKLEPNVSRSGSSATLVSRAESSKRQSFTPNSPIRLSTPLSPYVSLHARGEVAVPAPTYANENTARAHSPTDTPLSETIELPANGHAEDEEQASTNGESHHHRQ
jgi:brefeldin A-inhibited guanine nucleotide-exchange protein